jgi:toxin HigB-1
MKVSFKTTKLQKLLGQHKELVKAFGDKRARLIERRMVYLKGASNLQDVPQKKPYRCHELTGQRKGEFAVDVDEKLRIVFVPDHDPVQKLPDGGIDRKAVNEIVIIEVGDYHK